MIFELTLFASFALSHLILGAGLLSVLDLFFRLFRSSAELRSWVWMTAFLMATLLPLTAFDAREAQSLAIVKPGYHGGEAIRVQAGMRPGAERNKISQPALQEVQPLLQEGYKRPEWHIPGAWVFEARMALWCLLFVCLMGGARRTMQLAQSLWRTTCLRQEAHVVEDRAGLREICAAPLMRSLDVHTPMAVGLVRPVILLPQKLLDRLSDEQLKPIILHEQAHIDRRDLWLGLLQEVLAILFWWSPFMRLINYRIHIARELACDMRAATALASGKHYAQSLLDCAQLMVSERSNMLAMGLFTRKHELNHRINEVLKINKVKAPGALTTAAACFALSVLSYSTAHALVPAVNLESIREQSNYFAELSRAESEMLIEAIDDNNRDQILMMIENGLDINTPLVGDGTALIIAARNGDAAMLRWLLEKGANINQASRGDGNPLNMAALVGDLDIVTFLLANGARIDDVVEGDETALISASRSGHLDVVRYLVEAGADVNLGVEVQELNEVTTPYGNRTSRSDSSDLANRVSTKGATVGGSYTVLRTPLNMAGSEAIRTYLISRGAKE